MQKRACKAMRHILVTKFLDISPNSQSRTTQTNRKSNEKIKVDRRQETHLVYGFLTGALIRSSKASFASRVGTVTSWCTSSPSIPSMSKLNSRRTFSCLCAGAVAGLQTRKFHQFTSFYRRLWTRGKENRSGSCQSTGHYMERSQVSVLANAIKMFSVFNQNVSLP